MALEAGATGDPSASGYSIPGSHRAEFRRLTIADAFDRGFIALTSTSCIGASPSASTNSYGEERSERSDLSIEQASKYDLVINPENRHGARSRATTDIGPPDDEMAHSVNLRPPRHDANVDALSRLSTHPCFVERPLCANSGHSTTGHFANARNSVVESVCSPVQIEAAS